MSTWLVVWFVIALLTTVAALAFSIALIRHLLVLGRTARRMRDEVGPIVQEISTDGARASDRSSRLSRPR